MIDNFVRPLMISGRAEMSMLLIFIGVLGGIEAFGLLGVVLGPVIIAIAATLLNLYVPGGNAGNPILKRVGRKPPPC
jgi:predicted PurR-regulated permease PerM